MQRGWRTGGGNAISHRNTEGTERFPNFKSLSVLSVALWQILFFGIVRRVESSTRVGNPCHCFVFSACLCDLCGSAFGLGTRRRALVLRDSWAGPHATMGATTPGFRGGVGGRRRCESVR